MDLRNLQQLMAIRAHGSFAKAAQALGMSQPSLSQAIARLEDRLRVKLFERSATGSRLTPIGEMVVERAGKVMSEADQLIRDVELAAGGEVGEIRLGVDTVLKGPFLPPYLIALAGAYPGLRVNIQVMDRDRLVPLVTSREIDLALCDVAGDVGEAGLAATEVLRTRGVVVACPGHPILSRGPLTVEALADYPLAGGVGSAANDRLLGPGRGHVDQYVSNDYDALAPLAVTGACVLLAPEITVRPLIEAGVLVRAPLELEYPLSFAAISTRAAAFSPMVVRMVREAQAVGDDLVAAGRH